MPVQHKITINSSGHTFDVDEETPILSAGLAAGFYLPYSCRQGHCGNCRGRVVAGKVDHRDTPLAYLTQAERMNGEALLCQATAQSDIVVDVKEITGLLDQKPRIVPCRSVSVNKPVSDVAILRVRLPMTENMLFVAGQYVEFLLSDGARRRYSIANAPSAEGVTELEFHLKHMPAGRFTDHVFSTMKPRELLRFEGPMGTFFIRDSDKPIILCANGTGFAPIKSMLLKAFATKLHEHRPIRFYWGGRRVEDLYMLDLVRQWEVEYPGFVFHAVISGSDDDGGGPIRSGHVQAAILEDVADLSDHQVYACGSSTMVSAARQAFVEMRSLPRDEFYSDEFLPATISNVSVLPNQGVDNEQR